MTKKQPRSYRNLPKGLISIVIIAFCLQLSPVLAAGQTKSGSLLARLANRGSNSLRASFANSPAFPIAGQTVQFRDSSTGSPGSWQWDFGDGTGSTDQNPTHVYTSAGFRRVTLIAANSRDSRKVSKALAVIPAAEAGSFVFSPTTPGPGQLVQFADTSSGTPNSWSWNFGDGSTSTVKNPSHSFIKTGAYMVSLIATASSGSKQTSKTVMVASMSVLTSSFVFTPTLPSVGQAVQFTDTSTGSPTSWSWSFGDGATSTAQNPSHIYTTAGAKAVTLTATNSSGSNTSSQTVTVATALTAAFTFSPTSPVTGQSVQFTDMSSGNPDSWSWNFGDGATSTAQNPTHTYTTGGTKTVILSVTNGSGTNSTSRTVTLAAPLTASFTFSPSSPIASQSVQFTDTSTGSPSIWQWTFGDESTSSGQNPSHAFISAGSYSVTLTVMNASGQNSVTLTITIAPASTLVASFTYSPASPSAGQVVQFTDASTGGPTSWTWAFGDGSTSSTQSPGHTYTTAGAKTVILTVANSSGSKNVSKTVTVVAALSASFTYSPTSPTAGQAVQFMDESTGSPTSWLWNFGDLTTSTTQNPIHTFVGGGSYGVTLTVTNSSGSKILTQTVIVAALLSADFTFTPSSPVVAQSVQFMDTSTGNPTSWLWNFGDGSTSTAKGPTHTYVKAGAYPVTLNVANDSGSKNAAQTVNVVSSSSLTHYAASPALSDVQAAINSANPGDTVIVPAGSATWASQLAYTKAVKIIGAGIGSTNITAGWTAPYTSLHDENFLLKYTESNPVSNMPVRISGFSFDMANRCEGLMFANPSLTPITKLRIDHCELKRMPLYTSHMLHFEGTIYGCVDNNVLWAADQGTTYRFISCYGNIGADSGVGQWTSNINDSGSPNNIYFEDNDIYWPGQDFLSSGLGGRYCIRYNRWHYVDAGRWTLYCSEIHGNMGGANRSGAGCDVYENTFDGAFAGNPFDIMSQRGGKGVAYNNHFPSTIGPLSTAVTEEYNDNLDPPANNLISGQPQHVSDYYVFNNDKAGVAQINTSLPYVNSTIDYGGSIGVVPRNDAHFWRHVSSFNGSTGVGVGLRAARPVTCTLAGAAYWATDESKLYRWHAGAWELYYTPYTYPHPLRTSLGD